MGKSTISMVIFNSYVKLPEGTIKKFLVFFHAFLWHVFHICLVFWGCHHFFKKKQGLHSPAARLFQKFQMASQHKYHGPVGPVHWDIVIRIPPKKKCGDSDISWLMD